MHNSSDAHEVEIIGYHAHYDDSAVDSCILCARNGHGAI